MLSSRRRHETNNYFFTQSCNFNLTYKFLEKTESLSCYLCCLNLWLGMIVVTLFKSQFGYEQKLSCQSADLVG